MNKRVLFVDDEVNLLYGVQRQFRNRYEVAIAQGPKSGLEMIRMKEPYAVVVADMRMPYMNGIQFLSEAMKISSDTVRIMLTGQADQQTAVDAVNRGHIFRFLNKPCDSDNLAMAIDAGIEQYRLITAEAELLRNTLTGSVRMLTELLASSSPETYLRIQRLKKYCRIVGAYLHLENPWELEISAMLSEIGRMALPAELVAKYDAKMEVTSLEESVWERTPIIGYQMLNNIPRMETIAKIILYHHKCYSGAGFPRDDVRGEDIPMESRIIKALSDFVEMEMVNSSRTVAYRTLMMHYGWYDPLVVEAIDETLVRLGSQIDEDTELGSPMEAEESLVDAVSHRYTDKEVHELVAGDVLFSDLVLLDGKKILPKGVMLSPIFLEKVLNYHRIKGVKEPVRIAM